MGHVKKHEQHGKGYGTFDFRLSEIVSNPIFGGKNQMIHCHSAYYVAEQLSLSAVISREGVILLCFYEQAYLQGRCHFACIHVTLKKSILHPKHIHTCWRESKLSAGHISIISIPEVITHSAPLVDVAYLNSTLKRRLPILESDITICTRSWWRIWIRAHKN